MTDAKLSALGVPYEMFDGTKYTLVWTFQAAMRAERAGWNSPSTGTITNSVIMLWACLLQTNKAITIEEAADIFNEESFKGRGRDLQKAILTAVARSSTGKDPDFSQFEKAEDGDPDPLSAVKALVS